ncbi:MAG: flagellar motor switch protein FliN [Pseudomonadota bacterium]
MSDPAELMDERDSTPQTDEIATTDTSSVPDFVDTAIALSGRHRPISSIENVPVRVSAVLGKTKIDFAALKELSAGSVIELDRRVGEPIDLYVNDQLVARGELVLVDGSIAVTMTEIVSRKKPNGEDL